MHLFCLILSSVRSLSHSFSLSSTVHSSFMDRLLPPALPTPPTPPPPPPMLAAASVGLCVCVASSGDADAGDDCDERTYVYYDPCHVRRRCVFDSYHSLASLYILLSP